MASTTMYRVGDYVYFEIGPTSPFQIRRIEELNKSPTGSVDAKVMCFFRRRDLPTTLTCLADRHQSALEEEEGKERDNIGAKERHLLKHRELFLSRQVETLPATQIRGKCSVTLLNETESLLSYLNKEDMFFYSLVYDPQQRTLLADRGEIRVGQRYQAETPKYTLAEGETDGRDLHELETIVWNPCHHLTDKQIDQFLVISRSVGTFARALDCSSSIKQPSLHMSAAAASRDVTLFHAMNILHQNNYDIAEAASDLVPSTGPVLCRDEIEDWSASEANLFEEALEKYGKDFHDIRCDYLPWKTPKNIVEYYYMWKTTDRYVQQKRVKAAENESKLKQVYIPNYNKPSPAALVPMVSKMVNGSNTPEPLITGKPCESCLVTASIQWYVWTGPNGIQARLCSNCWNYWRKYAGMKNSNKIFEGESEIKKPKGPSSEDGDVQPTERAPAGLLQQRVHRCGVIGCGKDFKMKSQLLRHYGTAHGYTMRTGSPQRPVMKTRTAFYLHTTPMTRVARRLCGDILKTRHATRSPFWPINVMLIKQECQAHVMGKAAEELKALVRNRRRKLTNVKVSNLAFTLGQPTRITPEWLILTDKSKLPKPVREAYPKPPKAPDGSLIYERIPEKYSNILAGSLSPTLLKKRGYEELNGIDAPPLKRMGWDLPIVNTNQTRSRDGSPLSLPFVAQGISAVGPTLTLNARAVVNHMNGTKAKLATVTRIGSRKQIISWMDAPDDLYFCSTDLSKKNRRSLTANEMRRLARSPCKKIITKGIPESIMPGPRVVPPIPSALSVSNLAGTITNPILPDTKVVPVWRSISPAETSHHDRRKFQE